MKMYKKAIPLTVTKALLEVEKIISGKDIRVEAKTDDNLLHLESNFIDQKFFFRIQKYEPDPRNKILYVYSFMPGNEHTFKPINTQGSSEILIKHLQHWMTLISIYHDIDTPFQDKFEEYYAEQFEEQIQILDDDADIKPYGIATQKKLHEVLNRVIFYLEENYNQQNKEQVEIITEESKALQAELGTKVKNQVARRFYSILGKLWKLGYAVFEGALGNAAFELVKKLLSGG